MKRFMSNNAFLISPLYFVQLRDHLEVVKRYLPTFYPARIITSNATLSSGILKACAYTTKIQVTIGILHGIPRESVA